MKYFPIVYHSEGFASNRYNPEQYIEDRVFFDSYQECFEHIWKHAKESVYFLADRFEKYRIVIYEGDGFTHVYSSPYFELIDFVSAFNETVMSWKTVGSRVTEIET